MKNLVCILIVFCSFAVFAQNNQPLRIGYQHLESISYRTISANDELSSFADSLNVFEKPLRGASHTLIISKNLSSDIEVQLGLGWNTFGVKLDTNVYLGYSSLKSKYGCIEVPFMVNKLWKFKSGLTCFGGIGGSYNRIINHDVTYTLLNSNFEVTNSAMQGVQQNLFMGKIEVGTLLNLDLKWQLRLAFSGKYSFSSISSDAIKRQPYQYGITVSLFRTL